MGTALNAGRAALPLAVGAMLIACGGRTTGGEDAEPVGGSGSGGEARTVCERHAVPESGADETAAGCEVEVDADLTLLELHTLAARAQSARADLVGACARIAGETPPSEPTDADIVDYCAEARHRIEAEFAAAGVASVDIGPETCARDAQCQVDCEADVYARGDCGCRSPSECPCEAAADDLAPCRLLPELLVECQAPRVTIASPSLDPRFVELLEAELATIARVLSEAEHIAGVMAEVLEEGARLSEGFFVACVAGLGQTLIDGVRGASEGATTIQVVLESGANPAPAEQG